MNELAASAKGDLVVPQDEKGSDPHGWRAREARSREWAIKQEEALAAAERQGSGAGSAFVAALKRDADAAAESIGPDWPALADYVAEKIEKGELAAAPKRSATLDLTFVTATSPTTHQRVSFVVGGNVPAGFMYASGLQLHGLSGWTKRIQSLPDGRILITVRANGDPKHPDAGEDRVIIFWNERLFGEVVG